MKQSLHVISLMDKTYGVDSHSCKLPFFLWVNEGLEGLNNIFRVSSVQSLSCVWLFVTPWIAACQTSLSITNSQSLLKLMSIELVMPSNHLILCHPLLFLPSIFPSIRVFSTESVLHIMWPNWSFTVSISLSNEYSGLISFRIDWSDSFSRAFSPTTCFSRMFQESNKRMNYFQSLTYPL